MNGPTLERIPTSGSLLEHSPILPPTVDPKVQEDVDAAQRCTICNSDFNLPRPDGLIEKAAILPCSHIFGNICIQRWLETSLHNDCPICRRPMLYRTCRHIIKACEVEKAPTMLREQDIPERCKRCRIEDGDALAGIGLKEELREMMLAKERALVGMRTHLPGLFGGMCRSTVESVEERIEEVKKVWERELDAAFGDAEEKEGRLEW